MGILGENISNSDNLKSKFNDLETSILQIKNILECWPIGDYANNKILYDNKIKFFEIAESIVWESRLKWFIEKITDCKIGNNINYSEQPYSIIIKIFDMIKLDILNLTNIDIEISSNKNNSVWENKDMDNNSEKTSEIIKEEIIKNEFGWENLRLILRVNHNINVDNFDDVLDDIKENSTRVLKDMYSKILFAKSQMIIKDIDLKDALEDVIIVLKKNIETEDETEDEEKENLKREEKKNQLKKESLRTWFHAAFPSIEQLIIDIERQINEVKWNKNIDINNSKNDFISTINLIFNNISLWIAKYSSLSWTVNEINSMLLIYNKQTKDQYINAMRNGYLLWDIYELIFNIEKIYGIKFDNSKSGVLENKLQEYKLKSELNL